VYGAFWHHDGAAKGPKPIGYGNCWVVAGIIVDLPFLARPVCLPLLARLCSREAPGRSRTPARWSNDSPPAPDRAVHVVGDAAYISEHLRRTGREHHLDLTTESHLSALPAAPARTGRRSAQDRGPRLGTPGDLAAPRPGTRPRCDATDAATSSNSPRSPASAFGVLHTQLLRVILVRDDKPRTKDKDERGYGLPLVTTDLTTTPEDLIGRYASRWSIEPVFFGARRILGVGEARNRLRNAVQRTVPFG